MQQFELTDDQRQIQEMAQQFTAAEITPNAGEWDEKHIFPRDTIRQAAELGFGSIYVSEESGGIGLGRLESALIFEAMSYGCPSTSAFISIHNMASWMIDRFGSDAVKQKYLPSMIPMERMGSYCLTEPGSGSDAGALKTRAVLDGDQYVVSGSKAFISGGGENEIYVTMVRTSDDGAKGITAFMIDTAKDGFHRGKTEPKLGIRASATCEIEFTDYVATPDEVVGKEGEGFKIAMGVLDAGRIGIAAQAVGLARAAYEAAVAYVQERKSFGQPIGSFQMIQAKIADMKCRLDAATLLTLKAAWAKQQSLASGARFSTEASVAKLFSSEAAMFITHQAVQIHGGMGYSKEMPLERYFRDAKITEIYEGTSEIQRLVIARNETGVR